MLTWREMLRCAQHGQAVGRRFFKAKPFRMTLHCEAVTLGKRFFLLAVVRMTSFCNFFPAAKKLPRKVARSLSGTPAFRFARRRGCGTRSAQTVLALFPPSPLRLRRPIKAESGIVTVAVFFNPSVLRTPPLYFPTETQGRRIIVFCISVFGVVQMSRGEIR